jgi:hypothetical protein
MEEDKNHLTLYIRNDIKELAKNSGLNLSKEFEEWIKIRLGKMDEIKNDIDIDLEVAKHHAEIVKLQSQKELQTKQDFKDKEEDMVLDNIIDDMEKERTTKTDKYRIILEWKDFINHEIYGVDSHIHGIQFLFKKKFNKDLNPSEAKDLILKRLKEKGFIKEELN